MLCKGSPTRAECFGPAAEPFLIPTPPDFYRPAAGFPLWIHFRLRQRNTSEMYIGSSKARQALADRAIQNVRYETSESLKTEKIFSTLNKALTATSSGMPGLRSGNSGGHTTPSQLQIVYASSMNFRRSAGHEIPIAAWRTAILQESSIFQSIG